MNCLDLRIMRETPHRLGGRVYNGYNGYNGYNVINTPRPGGDECVRGKDGITVITVVTIITIITVVLDRYNGYSRPFLLSIPDPFSDPLFPTHNSYNR